MRFEPPQLLMLSGIGPADQLREHGIAPVADAPGVGRGLQDHPAVVLPFRLGDNLQGEGRLYDAPDTAYELLGRGPLSALAQSVALVAAGSRAADPAALPEIVIGITLLGREQGLADDGTSMAAFTVGLVDPESAGTVRIASGDPDDAPLIDPCYLSAPADRPRLRDGVRKGLALLTSRACATRSNRSPGLRCKPTRRSTPTSTQPWPPSSTPSEPHGWGPTANAVLTAKLEVRGFSGLWVADASVMPRIIRGLPQAPTIAIAERAARFIAATLPDQAAVPDGGAAPDVSSGMYPDDGAHALQKA